jgi:REP element-mobilizing transposase RayT
MPRKPRVFIEGALYHIYNRSSHEVSVFEEAGVGDRFAEILADELKGDGHTVYAWVVMGNHYHVVLRRSAVTLARTFGKIQSSFGRFRNRLVGLMGPTWQSRYKAKLVLNEDYLLQLISYVHLNPVVAGMVDDPADHELSGHREVLGLSNYGLIDREQVLALYGDTVNVALRNYQSALAASREGGERWLRLSPGRLPWWGRQVDKPLEPPTAAAWVDVEGRPNRAARPRLSAQEFVEAACAQLGMSADELSVQSRKRELANARFLVVGLGIERWGQRAGELAGILGRRADYVSWWARRARQLRLDDPGWAERYYAMDENLRKAFES